VTLGLDFEPEEQEYVFDPFVVDFVVDPFDETTQISSQIRSWFAFAFAAGGLV
jgi:hypothetical protein